MIDIILALSDKLEKKVIRFFKFNASFISGFIVAIAPLISMWLVYFCYQKRGKFALGGEIFIPFILLIIAFLIKSVNEIINEEQYKVPIPRKRFTHRILGAVRVDKADVYEMTIYMADLEDWLENTGKM